MPESVGIERRQGLRRSFAVEELYHVLEPDGRPMCHRWVDIAPQPSVLWAEVPDELRCRHCKKLRAPG